MIERHYLLPSSVLILVLIGTHIINFGLVVIQIITSTLFCLTIVKKLIILISYLLYLLYGSTVNSLEFEIK